MDRLHEIADAAARHDPPGCEDGVAWGNAHTMAEVAEHMLPQWAWWVVENIPAAISADERKAFLTAVQRDPSLTSLVWRLSDALTKGEADEFLATARQGMPTFRDRYDRGLIRPAATRRSG